MKYVILITIKVIYLNEPVFNRQPFASKLGVRYLDLHKRQLLCISVPHTICTSDLISLKSEPDRKNHGYYSNLWSFFYIGMMIIPLGDMFIAVYRKFHREPFMKVCGIRLLLLIEDVDDTSWAGSTLGLLAIDFNKEVQCSKLRPKNHCIFGIKTHALTNNERWQLSWLTDKLFAGISTCFYMLSTMIEFSLFGNRPENEFQRKRRKAHTCWSPRCISAACHERRNRTQKWRTRRRVRFTYREV